MVTRGIRRPVSPAAVSFVEAAAFFFGSCRLFSVVAVDSVERSPDGTKTTFRGEQGAFHLVEASDHWIIGVVTTAFGQAPDASHQIGDGRRH